MACTKDFSNCGILNTCDAQGKNCKSVYLGVTNGFDRTLTVSAANLGPNRSTEVRMCLRDPNLTPLPATEIRYDIGSVGPAKVTINDKEGSKGALLTGSEGCANVKITSSGQIPGSQPIEIQFTSDYVAAPVPVTIKSPGAGKMDGLFSCEFEFDKGAATCSGTLRLTDDEGSPMSGVSESIENSDSVTTRIPPVASLSRIPLIAWIAAALSRCGNTLTCLVDNIAPSIRQACASLSITT